MESSLKPEERNLSEKERGVIKTILLDATDEEKIAFNLWANQMLQIRETNKSKVHKGVEAIKITAKSNVIIPVLKVIAKELNLDQFDVSKVQFASKNQIFQSVRKLWSRRSLGTRVGVGVATATAIFFGGQGAGIAALGTAIGLPLWVVFGGGAMVLTTLIEEITSSEK